MPSWISIAFVSLVILLFLARTPCAQEPKILKSWDFHEKSWTYSNGIIDPRIENSILEFTGTGSDPILSGPEYEPLPANNHQQLEIRLKADSSGTWQLFYSNTNEGRFAGYSEKWSVRWEVQADDDWQVVRVSPFWKALGNTIKIRVDPAPGHCLIDWIRIVEQRSASGVSWLSRQWWVERNIESISVKDNALVVQSSGGGVFLTSFISSRSTFKSSPSSGGGVFLTSVDADSALTPVLYFRAAGAKLDSFAFCWANDKSPGLHTVGLELNPDGNAHTVNVDLSQFDEWRGQIDTAGFIFGQGKGDVLILEDFALSDVPQGKPELELDLLLLEPVMRRVGQSATLSAYVRNVGYETFEGGDARCSLSHEVKRIPPLKFNEKGIMKWQFRPGRPGNLPVEIEANGQSLSGYVRVEPEMSKIKADYVPKPQPVNTEPYEIGIYYFPGWSPDQWSRWEKQKGFPERSPVLGFYREGDPDVADWHIKWAVENGISFFMYDWYWRNGKIALEKGLEDGYLKARYRDYLKFCVMWANHSGFADHSLEQLLTVTDYWIENYFRLDCYYRIDGKPVVSFFTPANLTRDLNGKVREAFDAIRKRVKDAGLPGIYIIACGDNSSSSQKRYKEEGYDAVSAYNYPGAGAMSQHSAYKYLMKGHVPIWDKSLRDQIMRYIPLLTVGWDSRPWHGQKSVVRFNRSSELFKEGLTALREWMDAHGEKVGLLEAWNEWGEGSYIEPNSEFGFGDLEAIRSVFAEPGDWPQNVAPSDVETVP